MPNHKISKDSVYRYRSQLKLATFPTHHTILYLISLIISCQQWLYKLWSRSL